MRFPLSTNDGRFVTRNPGRLLNSNFTWAVPATEIDYCGLGVNETQVDWISCFNRLTGGIYATPLLYSGTFYDSDVSYAPVLPVLTAIIAMIAWAIVAIGNLIAWLVVRRENGGEEAE